MERLTMKRGAVVMNEKHRLSASGIAAKAVRIITAPHFMAMLLATILYSALGDAAFSGTAHYLEALFTLGLLPMLPYAFCMLVPSLRRRGRKLERTLAIAFSVLGYVMGTLFALLGGGTVIECVLFLTYLISGGVTALLSFVLKFRASGHTCGVSGPAAMLVYCIGPVMLPMFALLVPVFVSSLRLKRHSIAELAAGCAVPVAAMFASLLIMGAL